MAKGTKKCHVQRIEIYFQNNHNKTFLDKVKLTKTNI